MLFEWCKDWEAQGNRRQVSAGYQQLKQAHIVLAEEAEDKDVETDAE